MAQDNDIRSIWNCVMLKEFLLNPLPIALIPLIYKKVHTVTSHSGTSHTNKSAPIIKRKCIDPVPLVCHTASCHCV